MAIVTGSMETHFSPQDFWLFYNEPNPTSAGANGGTATNDCIALLENATLVTVPSSSSSPSPSIVDVFSTQFGLPAADIRVFPTDPSVGPSPPTDNEPQLDVEWAHAVAPTNTRLSFLIFQMAFDIIAV
jgi:subtilase family serine protease